ncbi:butyrophilin subfamily 3 member A3-like [Hypomesus transpacificus]|uniref:butyrophilin subfamily 3 member A3-like n=1 Tax=Hypomesus transpacificus TaxID=137520 RepID=UPI001F07A497|nr:butyrophilin subfamily 3 member A3-like [Hypomesus transpacificus]
MMLTLPGCVFWIILLLLHTADCAVGSQPVVSIEGHIGAGMVLLCETQGWYPEPEVVWLDSEGDPLSADPLLETNTDSVGLYTLRLSVTVQETDRNLFNCRVKQKYLKGDETARIHVPDELFYQNYSWKVPVAVVLGVCVVGLAMAICVLVKRQRHKMKRLKTDTETLISEKDKLIHEKASIIHEKDQLNREKYTTTDQKETLSEQLDLVNTRGCQDYEVVRRHAVDVTLDPDTAHPRLILSNGGKQVSNGSKQALPNKPERYSRSHNVLGKQRFSSGRFYYEVRVKNKTEWHLGVAKETCQRNGENIGFRPNCGYWTIRLKEDKYLALTKVEVHLHLSQEPQKVGVFVDYEEGMVSFYNVEAKCRIFSFTGCAFTETLYPFFSPALPGNSGENSAALIICPV